VLPRLAERAAREGAGALFSRAILLSDIGESNVATLLEDIIRDQTDPTIALYASPALVKVRLATKDRDEAAAKARLSALEAVISERLCGYVFGTDEDTMESCVGRLLREAGQTLAVAESCTGGLVASRITDVPGASDYFLAGIVAYANEAKVKYLGVPAELLEAHGAVSEECARAMAEGVRAQTGADWGLATTGIAGPTGGTPAKPVGLVFIASAGPDGVACEQQKWPGTRDQFKQRVSQMALNLLRKRLMARAGTGR
jgi:nicotinamide-nucleotide amidase